MKEKLNVAEMQLKQVTKADLSHFDPESNTYMIPKRSDIKLEIERCYLIHLQPQFFANETIRVNWNRGSLPSGADLKVEISQIMGKMIKVVGVEYDPILDQDKSNFWTGWIPLDDIEIKRKL